MGDNPFWLEAWISRITNDPDPEIRSFSGNHKFLSNFVESPVVWGDFLYPTVEHAYQAAKTLNPDERLRIQGTVAPGTAKRLGRRVTLRPDWEHVKKSVMQTLLARKFADATLGHMLLATGNKVLVEGNTWGDTYWGVDERTGHGQNVLGELLMELRSALRGSF